MSRWLLVVGLTTACSHAPPGPAWPKAAVVEAASDGGESIAPHARAVATATAATVDDDVAVDVKPAAVADKKDAPAAASPAVVAPVIDDPIFDDLTIEVEDD
ncbi:MAG: hypothetical protein NT062_10245 [Proteobacteria bacterium]|nr:hypothetical protein [Pseudomonadota bacterium]